MLIIFDCDGVLRSASWDGLFKAYIEIIKYLGKDYRRFFHDMETFKNWWNTDWKKNNEKLGITNSEITEKIFYEHYEPYVALFPWAPDTLKRLSQKHTLAISSNASEKSIKNFLGKIADCFSLIIGSDNVKKLKPDPEGANFILKNLGVSPLEAVMVGDMMEDIIAGRNAGTKIGAVRWGLGEWKDLLELKPDYKFERPEDLLSI